MTTIAIDPGKRSGWCLLHEGRPTSGVVDGDDLMAVWTVLDDAQRLTVVDRPCTLVLEDQYHARMRGKGLTTLFRRRFAWETLARWMDMQIQAVNPMTWQAHYRIKRGDKQAVAVVARSLCGYAVQPDEADAVCMAYWWEAQVG